MFNFHFDFIFSLYCFYISFILFLIFLLQGMKVKGRWNSLKLHLAGCNAAQIWCNFNFDFVFSYVYILQCFLLFLIFSERSKVKRRQNRVKLKLAGNAEKLLCNFNFDFVYFYVLYFTFIFFCFFYFVQRRKVKIATRRQGNAAQIWCYIDFLFLLYFLTFYLNLSKFEIFCAENESEKEAEWYEIAGLQCSTNLMLLEILWVFDKYLPPCFPESNKNIREIIERHLFHASVFIDICQIFHWAIWISFAILLPIFRNSKKMLV